MSSRHGGIERGTITLMTGPSGVGKTTVGVPFMKEAARRVERTAAEGRLRQWSFEATDATLARRVRLDFLAELEAGGLRGEALSTAELVFSELLGNVVRYAPAAIDLTLDLSGDFPVLHVLDNGPGFQHLPKLPDDDFSERGRGLFIVSRFVEEFHVARRPNGGSHARAVLLRTTA